MKLGELSICEARSEKLPRETTRTIGAQRQLSLGASFAGEFLEADILTHSNAISVSRNSTAGTSPRPQNRGSECASSILEVRVLRSRRS